MSADIPAGRELDRAVALALGWKAFQNPDDDCAAYALNHEYFLDLQGRYREIKGDGEFSTDPRLQDELLAALDANGWHWEIRKHDLGVEAVCYHPDRELPFVAHGPTISVALCRLLLAVKGAS